VASTLLRVACLRIWGGRPLGPKFLPPSCRPPLLLSWRSWVGTQSPTLVDRKQLAAVCRSKALLVRRARQAKARRSRRPPTLVERETVRHGVSHQALVASALLRLARFLLWRSRSTGLNRNFCPRPVGPASPESRESWLAASRGGAAHPRRAGLGNDTPLCRARHPARPRPSRVDVSLTSIENSSLLCVASKPCGVCIVAR
jgi:hypothetical protein